MDDTTPKDTQPLATPISDLSDQPADTTQAPADSQATETPTTQTPETQDIPSTSETPATPTVEPSPDSAPDQSVTDTMAGDTPDQSTAMTSSDPSPTTPTPPTPQPEEPLIDLPKPKPALEPTATDGHTETSLDTPRPASLPNQPIVGDYLHAKNKPAIIGLISIILLVVTAGLAFLFVQNSRLKGQIRTIEDINSQRDLPPLSPTATPSGMVETPAMTVFSDLDAIITKAKAESETAQLLMITVDNLSLKNNDMATYNYWFRTGPGTGQYFQIAKPAKEDYKLIKPATVNPDNNIPDLLESKTSNTLGIDDQQVIKLGWEKVASQFSQGNEPQTISLIYIIANPSNPAITTAVNLWQVTYFFPKESGVEDVIIQVNANNQDILFTNKNITIPTSTPEPTSSAS